MNLRVVSAKKPGIKLALNSVPASQLTPVVATRVLGKERELGQYKLENGELLRFQNFKSLRFYSNLVLRNKHKHIILVRGDKS